MDLFCKIDKVEFKSNIKNNNHKIFYKDKYLPKTREEFIINLNILKKLDKIIENGIINIFICGQPDVGKYTLSQYLVKQYFKNPCITRKQKFSIDGKELIYYRSFFHYELYVDQHNCNIINLIKNFLKYIVQPINSRTFDKVKNIIIIKNAHLLKSEIINLFKFYLDKHYNNIFIFIGNTFIPSLKGFFLNLIVPLPSNKEITKLIKKIIKTESLKVKKKELNYVIQKGNRQILKTVSLLERCFITDTFEEHFDSNDKIISFIFKLIKNPTINGMIQIRDYLNQLLVNNFTLKEINIMLKNKIFKDKKISTENKMLCMNYIIECDYGFTKGYRELHHLEYCLIRIINLLKNTWEQKKI
tara:strand:- start:34 stop:1107 length:1074 start_codon:yes stop_codon:yes gene_type:complete